jgi:hypothetical protein
MMGAFLSIPIMLALIMIQTGIASRLPLLGGTVDLLLLVVIAWGLQERVNSAWVWAIVAAAFVSFTSALPFYVPFMSFLLATTICRLLQRRVWQSPILAMLIATFIGTFLYQFISLIALQLNGNIFNLQIVFSYVILPCIFLNLIFSLPVYVIVSDLVNWAYPFEASG